MSLSHWGTYHSFNNILKIPSPAGRLLLEERHEADNEFPQVPVVKRFHIFERIPLVLSHLFLSGKVTNFCKRVWELACLQLKGMEQGKIYVFPVRLSFHYLFLFCTNPFFLITSPKNKIIWLLVPGFGEIFLFDVIRTAIVASKNKET